MSPHLPHLPAEPAPPGSPHCGACASCAVEDPAACAALETAPLRGTRLVALAALFFLSPLAFALVAATVAGPDPDQRSLAALLGLAGGLVLTAAVARVSSPRLELVAATAPSPIGAEVDHQETLHG